MQTRRQLIGIGATAAAAATVPGLLRTVQAAAPPAVADPPIAVDWHSHFVSRAEIKFLSKRQTPPRILTQPDGSTLLDNPDTASFAASRSEYSPSDIEARLENLNQHGIQRQLLTHTVAAGFDATVPLEELKPVFRAFNDELAQVVRRYPDKFLAVAALPTGDPVWAAQELRRAHQELGFIGGSLPLNAFATLEGARTLSPIFKAAQPLKSHFFIHRAPANPSVPGQPAVVVPEDTAYARWSLISNTHLTAGAITLGLTDFLDPFPDVTVQVIMLGGFFPYLIDTVVQSAQSNGVADPQSRLRRLYFDPGPYSRNGEWVQLAAAKLGADRILFGTDYGVGGGKRGDVGPAVSTLNSALAPQQRQLIYRDNSLALLRAKGHT
jgi:predicted TIM-barrel fold metal-dependent hydrolase